MDYISKLTDDELRIICGLVPLQHFRDCFKGNPQQFHRIWTSCRPEKVSLEIVQKLAVSNRRVPFISDVLNNSIQALLNIMQNRLTALTDTGDDLHTALLRLLPESQFCEHVDLYLKLSNPSYAPEYSELLQSALKEVEVAKKATEAAQAAVRQDDATETELEKLRDDLAKARKELGEQQVKEEEQKNAYSELEKKLREKKQELKGLQTLIDHADFFNDDSLDEKYPYVSLCRVIGVTERSTKLLRLADVVDGVIQDRWREEFPSRRDLYTEDQPMDSIGIWGWRIGSNPYTGSDGYIFSEFLTSQRPVQIIIVPDCRTTEDLKQRLLQGVKCCPEGERVLFSFADGGKYVGLLCEKKKNLSSNEKTVTLLQHTIALNLYEFSEQEIVKLGSLRFFYRVNLGIPKEIVQIADPFNIIKKCLLDGPAAMKNLSSFFNSRQISQKIREFLNGIPASGFYETVAAAFGCSLNESKDYVDEFIQRAETYLREDDIGTEVLEAALDHNADLLEKCRALNEERWRQEHTKQIERAKNELKQILDEVQRKTTSRDRLSEEQKRLEDQREILSSSIAQKEQLAKEVEEQVARRIDAAKKNAADFICEMAFAYPGTIGQAAITTPTESSLFQRGEEINGELTELHDAWDAVCSIQDELERAGVSEKHSLNFAAFLYAAYTTQTPLLLAGPNGRDIADALSAALFGRSASVLRCENDYLPSAVEACMCSEGRIVVVMNPLSSSWVDHISELTARKGKFLMMVHPFAEDLLIEPRGLYNYMLPVLTELFVDRVSVGNFRGGCFGDGFSDHVHAKPQKRIPLVERIAMPPLVQGKLRQILADTKALSEDSSADDDFLFGVAPYAYVIGKAGILREELQSGHSISKDTKSLLQAFLGEPE